MSTRDPTQTPDLSPKAPAAQVPRHGHQSHPIPLHPLHRLQQMAGNRYVQTRLMRKSTGEGTPQSTGQTTSPTKTTPDTSQHPELPPPEKGEKLYSYQHVEGKAFVRGVKPDDVEQLGLPACGLLAALSAVAATNPQQILNNLQHVGGDQWNVQLYTRKTNTSPDKPEFQSVSIRINQDLPVYADTGVLALVSGTEAELKQESIEPLYDDKVAKDIKEVEALLNDPVLTGEAKTALQARLAELQSKRTGWKVTYGPDMTKRELWPALYVKAVAILVSKYPILPRRGNEPGGYDDLKSIGADVALEIITGQPAQFTASTETSEDELFTIMNRAWLNNQPVVASSLSLNQKKEDPIEIGNSGVYYDHAYTVLRTWKPEGAPVVDLRNPWNQRYANKDLIGRNIQAGANNAEFRLDFPTFKRLFVDVSIGNQGVAGVIQRTAANTEFVTYVPSIVYEVLRSSGQPLDLSTRMLMEPYFGDNFRDVRIHTDSKATESARSVNALAYTLRQDIVFGTGQYNPFSQSGQKLLAHELTHVIQQKEQHANIRQTNFSISTPEDPTEGEANAIADFVSDHISSKTRPYSPDLAVKEKSPDIGQTSRVRNVSVNHFLSDTHLARHPDAPGQDPSSGFTPATPDAVDQAIVKAEAAIACAQNETDLRAAEDQLMTLLGQRIAMLNAEIAKIEAKLPKSSENMPEESQSPTGSDLLQHLHSLQEKRQCSQQQLRLLRRGRARKEITEIEAKLSQLGSSPSEEQKKLEAERERLGKMLSSTAEKRIKPGTAGNPPGEKGYVVYRDEVKVDGTLAWRNNNPGNLGGRNFEGVIGFNPAGAGFAVFEDPKYGFAAIATWWKNRPTLSIKEGVFQYSQKPKERMTEKALETANAEVDEYCKFIQDKTGILPSTTVQQVIDKGKFESFAAAIAEKESSKFKPDSGKVCICGSSSSPLKYRNMLGCDE